MADILLVEDNDALGAAYKLGLEQRGHGVRVATGEAEMHRMLGEGLPDLLLLDVGLPGANGIEVLSALREAPATAGLRVAVLSNFENRDYIHRALQLDAIDYIEKTSITPILLADQVDRWLER